MQRLVTILLLLTAFVFRDVRAQTILGKHPADKVLPGFMQQNTNANTILWGINTYATAPYTLDGTHLTQGTLNSNIFDSATLTVFKLIGTGGGGGSGNVNGPASAVAGNLASYNGTTGKAIADSGVSSSSFGASTNAIFYPKGDSTDSTNLMLIPLAASSPGPLYFAQIGNDWLFGPTTWGNGFMDFHQSGDLSIANSNHQASISLQGGQVIITAPTKLTVTTGPALIDHVTIGPADYLNISNTITGKYTVVTNGSIANSGAFSSDNGSVSTDGSGNVTASGFHLAAGTLSLAAGTYVDFSSGGSINDFNGSTGANGQVLEANSGSEPIWTYDGSHLTGLNAAQISGNATLASLTVGQWLVRTNPLDNSLVFSNTITHSNGITLLTNGSVLIANNLTNNGTIWSPAAVVRSTSTAAILDGAGSEILFDNSGNILLSPNGGTVQAGNIFASSFSGSGSGLTSLNASQLSSGTVPIAQLPPGVITNNNASTAITNLARFTNAGPVGITGTLTLNPSGLNPGAAILPLGVDANGDVTTNGVPAGVTYSGVLGGTNILVNLLFGASNYFYWPLTNSDNWIDITGYWVTTGNSPARAVFEFHTTNSTYQVHFSTNFVFGSDITGTNWTIGTNVVFGSVIGTFPGQATNGVRVVSEVRGYQF